MSVSKQLSLMLNREIIYFNEVNHLINLGAEPNSSNDQGETYLHYVCRHHGYESILEALKIGVNPEILNKLGETALSLYLTRRPLEHRIVEALVQYGANPNTFCQGETYLHLAIRDQMPVETVLAAINLGIDVTLKTPNGLNAPSLYKNLNGKSKAIQSALSHSFKARTLNEFNYETIIRQPKVGEFVCDLLAVNELSPDLIIRLAKTETLKERVYNHIERLPLTTQKSLVDLALDGHSPLYQFFSVQRGFFQTSTSSGLFSKLINLQFEANKKHILSKERCFDLTTEPSASIYSTQYYVPLQQFPPSAPPMYNPAFSTSSFGLSQVNQSILPFQTTQLSSINVPSIDYNYPMYSPNQSTPGIMSSAAFSSQLYTPYESNSNLLQPSYSEHYDNQIYFPNVATTSIPISSTPYSSKEPIANESVQSRSDTLSSNPYSFHKPLKTDSPPSKEDPKRVAEFTWLRGNSYVE